MTVPDLRREGLVLRPARPDDTPEICTLLGEFDANPKADPAVYDWQYWDNPFGRPTSWVWVAEHGQVVCHGGLYATPGVLGGADEVVIGRTSDSVTAASHRRLGLFAELAAARFADASARTALTLSLPNPQSTPGLRRAGMQIVGRVDAWILPLDDAALAARLHVSAPLAGVVRRLATGPSPRPTARAVREALPVTDAEIDELWARLHRPGEAGIRRGASWWRWRYASHPARWFRFASVRTRGRLAALTALTPVERAGTRFLYLMDALAEDPGGLRRAVEEAAATSPAALAVVALAMPGHRHAHLLAAAGFRRLPHRLHPDPMHLGLAGGRADATDTAGRAWQVSWGDHDHL